MSRQRPRIGTAFTAGMQRAEQTKDNAPSPPPKGSGNWSKMARESMEQRLKEARHELDGARNAELEGIMEGVVPIHIPAARIVDEVGTDRILTSDDKDDLGDSESFQSLVENIRQRGQRVPIRVRPRDPDWKPDPTSPRDVGDQMFILQSGRRRLAACQQLGIAPLAFLSFASEDKAHIEDLQERFFENAVRKNLSLVEKLYSIGLIAQHMPDASQGQIAEITGVNLAYVSRGRAVVEFYDRLSEDLDLKSVTMKEIDQALKEYRRENRSSSPEARRKRQERQKKNTAKAPDLPFARKTIGSTKASLKVTPKGERVLSLQGRGLGDEIISEILSILDRGIAQSGED